MRVAARLPGISRMPVRSLQSQIKIVLPAHVVRYINSVVNKFAVPDVPINNALVVDDGMTVKMIYAG
ncbi:MAG TPA: hypothetical protein VII48_10475 [Rhizomicrobium sp.]